MKEILIKGTYFILPTQKKKIIKTTRKMNWKEHLVREGFVYSETNDDYRKGLSWGKSIKVWMFMKGLFVIEKNNKTVYRDFPESFEEFKQIIEKYER